MSELMEKSDPRYLARLVVNKAIRAGTLVPLERCEDCGGLPIARARRLDAHHHNGYGEERDLDVKWLCRRCHTRVHSSVYDKLTTEQRREIAVVNFVIPNSLLTHEQRSERSRRSIQTQRERGTLVAWNKGKKTPAEVKQRLSLAHQGQVPWNKGLKQRKNEE